MDVDFHRVPPEQEAIHRRLLNWSRYVRVRHPVRAAPMWRYARSSTRMWHEPDAVTPVDAKDGEAIEHAVARLPTYHASALRWAYVFCGPPARIVRELGVSYAALARLVIDGRALLMLYDPQNEPVRLSFATID